MKRIVFTGFLALAACGGSEVAEEAETVPADAPVAVEEVEIDVNEPVPAPVETAELMPGNYCYFHEDEVATEAVEIEVAEDGRISGVHYGTVHDEENAYFTAFDTTLSAGEMDEDGNVNFQTVTEVDGDRQEGEQAWSITPDGATLVGFEPVIGIAECDGIVDRVWPPIEE